MEKCCTKSAEQIVEQKPFWPPQCLQHGPKHDQRPHVEQNVHDTSMYEKMGDQLEWLEIGRAGVIKRQHVRVKHITCDEQQHVEDQ